MSIKHDHTLNPVTALCYYCFTDGTQLLLAGEGSFLKVFDAKTSDLISQCEIFQGQTVHGITVNKSSHGNDELSLVLWGGHELALIGRKDVEQILDQSLNSVTNKSTTITDWIFDAAISEHDSSTCVIVTAHNALLKATFRLAGQEPWVEHLPSPSESILYSAQVLWDTPSRILVAAGTVFGEVIVWEGHASDGEFGDVRTLFTFTGHEGSIFGVNISPPVSIQGKSNTRLLASCSDDRTIRIWDLSALPTENGSKQTGLLLRETGFGGNERGVEADVSAERGLAVVMGHASRIWSVRFLASESEGSGDSNINVLSFGEDSTTQQWNLRSTGNQTTPITQDTLHQKVQPTSGSSHTLEHVRTFAFHDGKHIWSSALRHLLDDDYDLLTGGSDGKISQYPVYISDATSQSPCKEDSSDDVTSPTWSMSHSEIETSSAWDLDEILKCLPLPLDSSHHVSDQLPDSALHATEDSVPNEVQPKKRKRPKKTIKDAFNRYAFVSQDKFLMTTNFGRILSGQVGHSLTWEEISLPAEGKDDLRSYAIVEGFPEISLAFLAGAGGRIYAYSTDWAPIEIGKVPGKVADMFKIWDQGKVTFKLLATTLSTRDAIIFSISTSRLTRSERLAQVSFQLPPDFVVTSSSMCDAYIVLGSRKGSLAVYDIMVFDEPVHIWEDTGFSGGDAITTILPLTAQPAASSHTTHFLTTGRNGVYSIFVMSNKKNDEGEVSVELHPVHRGTPPFGPMIESAWFDGSDLILYGFKSKDFVVWNETKQYEIASVECGGAHRSYAYSPRQDVSDSGHFIFTKASKLYIYSQAQPSHKVAKPGGHGREVKACAVSRDKTLVATGAEDTTVRIWRYHDDGPSTLGRNFGCQVTIQQHTAGIQCLQWYGSEYLFSSGGNEEFFIWSVENIPGYGIGVVCEATCPDQSGDRDLRIMNFDVAEAPAALRNPGHTTLLISLAYSDSTIRIYIYDKVLGYTLIGTGKYSSSCLTQINHLKIMDNSILFLTASTDGYLPIWKLPIRARPKDLSMDENGENSFHPSPPRLEMISSSRVHQNAIKSLDFMASTPTIDSSGFIIVVTGGDDNALAISVRTLDRFNPEARSFILRSAHAAAITGVCIVSEPPTDGASNTFRVVSTSNDQRVKEWQICVEQSAEGVFTADIKMTGNVFTPVADIGDIAVLKHATRDNKSEGKVIIVGNGMGVWNTSSNR
ncbi:WD repeat protein-like protein [Amylocarpus encephaloides]|uniref:WD repeat protein-like protein n=1 Tax=Amylocarpus encephaloides TaxID=45428 RepID=A0A9P8C767_9HELO|nr:WD repeat protein-like protein [Amylocarpus encephaloides]